MNVLELRLRELNSEFLPLIHKTKNEVNSLLVKYDTNFPRYTDHSIHHTQVVFDLAAELLTPSEIANLNADEIYILSMACYLHDVGMCIPEDKIKDIAGTEEFIKYREIHSSLTLEEYIRDIHHELSYKFILHEWECLYIPNMKYAKAIGLVAQGHRKVDLSNVDDYKTKYFVKSGREFICLPYLACILRIADELDITNVRTPALLHKYYLPNNEISRLEWQKHIATTQVNFTEDFVSYKVKCTDQNMLAALETQFEKIERTLQYCQKVIRTIGNTEERRVSLNLIRVIPRFEHENFDPKGIKFSFDVQNVTRTFIGKDLYKDKLTTIREAVQNSIDSCLYKRSLGEESYIPIVQVELTESQIIIKDNGLGMDEFVVEHFFGRLASSFYEQSEIKNKFDAIGQFGIGVFSYFLLSEYIDVHTRMANGPNLKFRVSDDPKSYFHFFECNDDLPIGTTITLNLKQNYLGKITFTDLENYLKKYFRFIDLPIELIEGETTITQLKNEISINVSSEIEKRIKIEFSNKALGLDIITTKIEDELLIGECGLFIRKAKKGFTFDIHPYLDYEAFEATRYRAGASQIDISQKGVFINSYGGELLRYLVGNIGKTIIRPALTTGFGPPDTTKEPVAGIVIGVVEDFPYESMHREIKPLAISPKPKPHTQSRIIYVRLPSKNMAQKIADLERKWKQLFPDYGFDYWFIDEEFGRMYENETRVAALTEKFSWLAILVGCVGLYGLASFMAEQRTKEIGIRKTMGASNGQILLLLLTVFGKLLLIASIIGVPVAYILLRNWLESFVYRTPLSPIVFGGALLVIVVITLITVGYETLKASTANPIKAIRHEG